MMKHYRFYRYIIISLLIFLLNSSGYGLVSRILSTKVRATTIEELNEILSYNDPLLKSSIPSVVNPFFFEQPLVLKLRSPGGLNDDDVLTSFGSVLVSEISGAFVRGTKRFLFMKTGNLIKEGDTITRQLPEFGNIEISADIIKIDQHTFVLKLNNSLRTVQLSSKE